MNPKIKALTEAEGFDFFSSINDDNIPQEYIECWNTQFESFVNKLIKSCIDECNQAAMEFQTIETTYAAGKKAGALHCARMLEDKFMKE